MVHYRNLNDFLLLNGIRYEKTHSADKYTLKFWVLEIKKYPKR